jgi:hypothetical protein
VVSGWALGAWEKGEKLTLAFNHNLEVELLNLGTTERSCGVTEQCGENY